MADVIGSECEKQKLGSLITLYKVGNEKFRGYYFN